jgi:hypothetical protein
MFVRVQYTNLSSFYCIEACAWGNLTRLMLFYNMTDIAFSLLMTPFGTYTGALTTGV